MYPKVSLAARWYLACILFWGILKCIFFNPCDYRTEVLISLPTDKSYSQVLGAACLWPLHSPLSLSEPATTPHLCMHMCVCMGMWEPGAYVNLGVYAHVYAQKEAK